MDGMISDGNFKTKCCNAKPVYYYAKTYPYESGWKCPECGQEWSELQIARGQHLKETKEVKCPTHFPKFIKSIKKKTDNITKQKDCDHYLDGFCCKDLDSGRAWDCTSPSKEIRIKMCKDGPLDADLHCPYPKLGKEGE